MTPRGLLLALVLLVPTTVSATDTTAAPEPVGGTGGEVAVARPAACEPVYINDEPPFVEIHPECLPWLTR